MKKIYFLLLTIISLLASCYGGEDSTDIISIQQVTAVAGINNDTYKLYQGDTLKLSPKLSFSEGADTTLYTYRWIIGKSEVVSNSLNLTWAVSLPNGYSMAANIPGVFVVQNKENGLEFRQTFTFQVYSNYTPSYVVVYEKGDNTIEWMSLQGEPADFTRYFDNMVQRINPEEPIKGTYTGALYSTNELAIFTNHHPDYGKCISMRNADPANGYLYNVGEYTGNVYGKMYMGTASSLNIHNCTFGYGASKYFICNDVLHVFNGLDRKLPVFNENTFVKSTEVKQAISSKQFQRYKKATFVLHKDGHVGCYHVYDDVMEDVKVDGEPFMLDSLYGCFTEATGMGSNKPYCVYLLGSRNGEFNLYRFYVNYINRVVQPLQLEAKMPVDADFAKSTKYWWGSFGENYAFYTIGNSIYRFDYYEMETFEPATAKKLITFDADEEIVDVFPLTTGMGLRDEDDCTIVLLYKKATNTSSLYVYNTVTGKKIKEYKDIIPGKGVYITKKM
jgi:hypothetical protein